MPNVTPNNGRPEQAGMAGIALEPCYFLTLSVYYNDR